MMVSNETSLPLWTCLHSMRIISWNLSCTLCRLASIIILLISIACFTFNIRFLFSRRCQNSLVVSLVLASLMVLIISVPGILVQLFTCHRHCSTIYCRIEGFISYLSGCLCMLLYMMLSFHRYLSLCSYNGLFSHRYSTFICWFLSIGFTFPLVFGYFNSYVHEGLGFHCSINWQDQTNLSRLYILLSFMLMYFFPLVVIFFVTLRSHFIIRHAYSKHCLIPSFSKCSYEMSSTRISRQIDDIEQHLFINRYYVRKAADRERFRKDYHFLQSSIHLVCSYLISWTPYSIIAILQLLKIKFIFQHIFLITLSAFIAKLSVILAPFLYLSIMNRRFFKSILFK